MKKTSLLLVLGFLVMGNIQPLDLVKVGEWSHEAEYWDVKNKNQGLKATRYLIMLLHDQVLCEEWRYDGFSRIDYSSRYYIKNYLTGEITYRFENTIKLYSTGRFELKIDGFFSDQYGAYIFLLKDGGLVLFDVEEKREYIPGEPLKRPEYIYYIRDYSDGRKVLRHSLTTDKIEYIQFEKLTDNNYCRMLDDIGNNQLKLYDNYYDYILQLNETMTEIISVTKKKIIMENAAEYIIPINENKYIGFKSAEWLYGGDEIDGIYYILLLDENGRIQKEYRDIVMAQNVISINYGGMATLCLVSIDKQYILLFDSPGGINVYLYKIIYNTTGVLNDDRVRIRAGPNLSGEIKGVVNRMDKVEILETGQEKQNIGGVESVWYRIRTAANVEGWVFGAYIDITE